MFVEQWFRERAPRERWFADKGRAIARVSPLWSRSLPGESGFVLHVAEIAFKDGSVSRYFAALDSANNRDVTGEPAFTEWLLGSLLEVDGSAPELTWDRLEDPPETTRAVAGRQLGVQQSNTSIRYPLDVLIKVNRRLASGISPEAELSAVMRKSADRNATTTTYGSLWLEIPALGRACLAIASQFLPNLGDGWSTMLNALREVRARRDFAAPLEEVTAIAALTASMHRALVADPWRESVAPEVVGDDDVERWNLSASRALEQLFGELERMRSDLSRDLTQLVDLVRASSSELQTRLHGFYVLRRTHRMRIHGDYHLGQVLRKEDGTYVAIDFDGEPERPLSERRQKYSALRDVAGMLRSFAYARGTVEMERSVRGEAITLLREWESDARERFLATYVAGVSGVPFNLVPEAAEDIRQALNALELEKAIYECRYEINNRPDWLWLPLTRLVRDV